jgi:pimeloyl-ACP methyl ester carboxylesterase
VPEAPSGHLHIYYETEGDASGLPLLLVMGLGAQITWWRPELRAALVERGFYVVSFDNRDVGQSSWLDEAGVPDLLKALAGDLHAPYLLSDMAGDAFAVMDAVGLESAHILGASMGGMIVQTMAIERPERVRSVTSIMSTTGDPRVGQPRPDVVALLLRPPATSRQAAVDQAVAGSRAIGSPGYPFDEAYVRTRAASDYDRAFHPEGTARQLTAILASGDRTAGLRGVALPTLVVHGDGDPLVDVSGGRATAAAVPGAVLKVIPGMGHDLPLGVTDELVTAVTELATKAEAAR